MYSMISGGRLVGRVEDAIESDEREDESCCLRNGIFELAINRRGYVVEGCMRHTSCAQALAGSPGLGNHAQRIESHRGSGSLL